jgi:hypothetical protein
MAQTWRDEPAGGGHAETREEVLARVEAEKRERTDDEMTVRADPSTRRGVTRKTAMILITAAVLGYLLTALVVGIFNSWGVGFGSGFAGALVAAVLASFLFLQREDGKVAEETTAYAPERTSPDQERN